MVCVCFSLQSKGTNVFPKHILKSKARDQPIQTRKKLTPKLTFKKLKYCFLVEATKIENTPFPFKLLCQKPMLKQIEWRLQNGPITTSGILPVTT